MEFAFIDFWLDDFGVGIEALGSIHYLRYKRVLDGRTQLKLIILKRLGHRVEVVNQVRNYLNNQQHPQN